MVGPRNGFDAGASRAHAENSSCTTAASHQNHLKWGTTSGRIRFPGQFPSLQRPVRWSWPLVGVLSACARSAPALREAPASARQRACVKAVPRSRHVRPLGCLTRNATSHSAHPERDDPRRQHHEQRARRRHSIAALRDYSSENSRTNVQRDGRRVRALMHRERPRMAKPVAQETREPTHCFLPDDRRRRVTDLLRRHLATHELHQLRVRAPDHFRKRTV